MRVGISVNSVNGSGTSQLVTLIWEVSLLDEKNTVVRGPKKVQKAVSAPYGNGNATDTVTFDGLPSGTYRARVLVVSARVGTGGKVVHAHWDATGNPAITGPASVA